MQKCSYRSWVIVIAADIILIIYSSIYIPFGIFLKPITTDLCWDRGAVTAAFSIYMIINGFMTILSGRLSDKYGPRPLITVFGLMAGVGFILLSQVNSLWQLYLIWILLMSVASSCCYIPIISIIPKWFPTQSGKIMGFIVSGLSIGSIVLPPLSQWLITTYNWRFAYVTFGVVTLVCIIPLAQLFKQPVGQKGIHQNSDSVLIEEQHSVKIKSQTHSITQVFRDSRLWTLGLLLFSVAIFLNIFITQFPAYITDVGNSATVASSIVSVLALGSFIGASSISMISNRIGNRLTLFLLLSTIMVILIFLLFLANIWMLYTFAVVYGFGTGGIMTIKNLLTAELFGLKSFGMILAVVLLFSYFGAAVGGPLAGFIFDTTGSYHQAFIICVIACGFALILSLFLARRKKD